MSTYLVHDCKMLENLVLKRMLRKEEGKEVPSLFCTKSKFGSRDLATDASLMRSFLSFSIFSWEDSQKVWIMWRKMLSDGDGEKRQAEEKHPTITSQAAWRLGTLIINWLYMLIIKRLYLLLRFVFVFEMNFWRRTWGVRRGTMKPKIQNGNRMERRTDDTWQSNENIWKHWMRFWLVRVWGMRKK